MGYIVPKEIGHKPAMLGEEQKKRIRIYSALERTRIKAGRRRAEAIEATRGRAEILQEENRRLPHASEFVFPDREAWLPFE